MNISYSISIWKECDGNYQAQKLKEISYIILTLHNVARYASLTFSSLIRSFEIISEIWKQ